MEREIEEQIINEMQALIDKYLERCNGLDENSDEDDSVSKLVSFTLNQFFELKKIVNETIIEIKSIQEKYKDHLKDEANG